VLVKGVAAATRAVAHIVAAFVKTETKSTRTRTAVTFTTPATELQYHIDL